MRRFLIILFCICILLLNKPLVSASFSNESIVMPRYNYIQTLTTTIILDEDTGIATVKAYGVVGAGYTIDVECNLQQYIAARWTTIKSWTTSGSRYGSIIKQHMLYSGYSYRVYATYRVRDASGNLVETETDSYTCVYPS